jgi:integrase
LPAIEPMPLSEIAYQKHSTSERQGVYSPVHLDRAWRKARAAIGRPDLHFHDLRHSGLTWASAAGASLAELMRRGGHKSFVAAARYQHAIDERDREIADRLALAAKTNSERRGDPDNSPDISPADISRTWERRA